MMKSRSVDGGLGVHAEAHPVDYAEQRGGNNRRTARRAGDEAELAVAQQNRGSHGAERAMARGDGVGVGLDEAEESVGDAGLRGEVVHFVVEEKSGGGGDVRAVAV